MLNHLIQLTIALVGIFSIWIIHKELARLRAVVEKLSAQRLEQRAEYDFVVRRLVSREQYDAEVWKAVQDAQG